MWGKDTRDLAFSETPKEGYAAVICEGCGVTVVDWQGRCQGGCSDTKHFLEMPRFGDEDNQYLHEKILIEEIVLNNTNIKE